MSHSPLYIRIMNSAEWRRVRNAQLTRQPECERCAAAGRVTLAQCVHHITPIESGRTDAECIRLAFATGNLQSLCYACHRDIHAAEHSHSLDAHLEREQQRLEAWKERRQQPRATILTQADPRLPNPLLPSSGNKVIFENAVFGWFRTLGRFHCWYCRMLLKYN